jgi:hypothetical protein
VTNIAMEIIGWAGSLIIILVYALNSYQKIKSDSLVFYVLNIVGGILLIIYSFHKDAPPNIFINTVWVIIAVPALIKLLSRKS